MKYPPYDYAVIGGDMRQVYLAEELAHSWDACPSDVYSDIHDKTKRICCYALCMPPDEHRLPNTSSITAADSLEKACLASSCVICPIPLCKNQVYINQSALDEPLYLSRLLDALKCGQFFFAGCIPADFRTAAEEKGIHVFDLMENQSLAYFNSIATAEGAVCEAIQKSPLNLRHSRCAVLGYGRCGTTLTHYLKGMFCRISVFSNPEKERAQASIFADNSGTLNDFERCAGEFDFIFNTIPAPVISAGLLDKIQRHVTIIDIASAPGGIDYVSAEQFGLHAFHCLGLPGKYAPLSSAKALKETVEKEIAVFKNS